MKNLITMKRIFFFLVIPMVISNIVPSYSLAITQKKTKWNTNGSAFVNDGYDVVSYFKNNKALKGDKRFIVEWDEHMWLFATKQHADLFMKNPEKYAPQFGSYCSWAVSHVILPVFLQKILGKLLTIDCISISLHRFIDLGRLTILRQ